MFVFIKWDLKPRRSCKAPRGNIKCCFYCILFDFSLPENTLHQAVAGHASHNKELDFGIFLGFILQSAPRPKPDGKQLMSESEALLKEIEQHCRRHGTAESTFGRLAVNDGKFVSRLREGKNVTLRTLERVRGFMRERDAAERPPEAGKRRTDRRAPTSPFQFFDARQRYLAFVNTCNEKAAIGRRVEQEIEYLRPSPPALRLLDAGMGDATVLVRVLRALHRRFPDVPQLVTAKEISFDDVRLALEKLPERLLEHPATAIVISNLNYRQFLALARGDQGLAASLNWQELALAGQSLHEWNEQILGFEEQLAHGWQTQPDPDNGNPVYVHPSVLLLYRQDQRFTLAPILPAPGATLACQNLIIASQPWRARVDAAFKARCIIAPLLQLLAPGGRMIAIQSCGDDPGLELVQRIWPEEDPFGVTRHELIRAARAELGDAARDYTFNAYADSKSRFRFSMHTLPSGIGDRVGASTLFSAWNAAVYVNQIDEAKVDRAIADGRYLAATRESLRRHDGLWFNDESFVITRKPGG